MYPCFKDFEKKIQDHRAQAHVEDSTTETSIDSILTEDQHTNNRLTSKERLHKPQHIIVHHTQLLASLQHSNNKKQSDTVFKEQKPR